MSKTIINEAITEKVKPQNKSLDKLIESLIKECNNGIVKLEADFEEMRQNGETVTSFIYSHKTDLENKIKGLEFCKNKTIKELNLFLKTPKVRINPSVENIADIEQYANALAVEPSYADQWFRLGVEKYLEEAKKLNKKNKKRKSEK